MQLFTKDWSYSTDDLQERIQKIVEIEIPQIDKKEAYKKILSLIDLTTLEGSDNKGKIKQLCEQAQSYKNDRSGIPDVAAVCVYPPFVKQAKELLSDSNIQIASVAGAFPSGQSPITIKLAEIAFAVEQGADEIDMVISRGRFLE